jgi:hypothetical protein
VLLAMAMSPELTTPERVNGRSGSVTVKVSRVPAVALSHASMKN